METHEDRRPSVMSSTGKGYDVDEIGNKIVNGKVVPWSRYDSYETALHPDARDDGEMPDILFHLDLTDWYYLEIHTEPLAVEDRGPAPPHTDYNCQWGSCRKKATHYKYGEWFCLLHAMWLLHPGGPPGAERR